MKQARKGLPRKVSDLQRRASRHNRLHWLLEAQVKSGLAKISASATLTHESRRVIEDVFERLAHLKQTLRQRSDKELTE